MRGIGAVISDTVISKTVMTEYWTLEDAVRALLPNRMVLHTEQQHFPMAEPDRPLDLPSEEFETPLSPEEYLTGEELPVPVWPPAARRVSRLEKLAKSLSFNRLLLLTLSGVLLVAVWTGARASSGAGAQTASLPLLSSDQRGSSLPQVISEADELPQMLQRLQDTTSLDSSHQREDILPLVQKVGSLSTPQATETLKETLSSSDTVIQIEALKVLRDRPFHRNALLERSFRMARDHHDYLVRAYAVDVLGKEKSQVARRWLEQLLSRERDPVVLYTLKRIMHSPRYS